MADQILSLLLGKLVDYTAVPVGRQFNYLFCYNGNLEEFRRQLRGLEMAGLDVKLLVEAAERNGEIILPSVEDWLKRVESVSDESKKFGGEEDAIGRSCFNGPLNLKVRYQRGRKAKKKASELDAIKKEGKFDSVSLPAPPPPQIGFTSNENEFDFESRRSIFNQIMEAIKDDGVKMIGIWGMPGIGKTTLVKRVAKYAREEGSFEEVAMAVVSKNSSVRAIQGQIADTIGLQFTSESEEGRAGQLHQWLLARKKIMVILDDIWDSIELNEIGIPYGNQHKSCKIILTSRILDVCEQMGAEKNLKIDLLSENEALDLFLRMSGIDDRSSDKGRLAEKLSEECGRLPVSIVIVARGLLNKRIVSWEDMLNRLRKSDPDRKVRASIELSYDNLYREEEKMFFLLCALFPEDYEIPVQVLFEYGIGLNLFAKVDSVDQAVVRAQNLASGLKSQCLLLDEGDDNFVKMHDVIRDVARAIASEGKHELLVPEKTVISSDKLPDVLERPQLQILMLNCRYPNMQVHGSFFSDMKNLIVLDMSYLGIVQLPQSFATLQNLRTLRFIECDIGDISAIGKLQNLVSLSFYNSNIEVLPKEVGELSSLRLLDLSSCEGLKVIIPGVIQNLSRLEVLRVGGNIIWCDGEQACCSENASLSELINLSNLKILEICILDASMLPDDVLLFENLMKFKVSIGEVDSETMNIFSSSSQILKLARLAENELLKGGIKILILKAQHLELKDISGISVALPPPLGGYGLLKKLIVNQCKDINYVLDASESNYGPETLSLQQLHLIDLPLLKEISKGKFPSLLFGKLEHLKLDRLPSLVRLWPFQAESSLTTMEVAECYELEYVFEYSSSKSLSKLKELEVRNCRNLQSICTGKEQDDDFIFHELSWLKLSWLENLASFHSKCISESTLFGEQVIFPAMEMLDINNLVKFERIWHAQTRVESFFQLKVLKLTQCPELLVVFPPQATSCLRNLEELCIENCDKLETLFPSANVPLTTDDEVVLFPQLSTLELVNLPKFTAILSTASPNMSKTTESLFGEQVSFGKLSGLILKGLESMEEIWHGGRPATATIELSNLSVEGCDRLLNLFPSNLHEGLHNLETLDVRSCRSLEHVFAEEAHPPLLSNLWYMELVDLPELKQLWWNKSALESFGLPKLFHLRIDACPTLAFIFDPSIASRVENLTELFVMNCGSMEEIVAEKTGKKIDFPLVHDLYLWNLPCLKVKQNVEFPRARWVVVNGCFDMEESCDVDVRDEVAAPVRYFESFVELMKSGKNWW